MTKKTDKFLKEGISRYKQATYVYFTFRRELQDKLQIILKNYNSWGKLKPDFKSIKSTTYGQDYPLLNARISFLKEDELLTMTIAVNWYNSENDFPFFEVFLENENNRASLFEQFNWNPPFDINGRSLRYFPDPEKYDLDKDLTALLNEFVRAINTISE